MGYRSTVKIMLEPKAYEKVMNSIKEYNDKCGEEYTPFKPDSDITNKDGVHIIMWEDVKWYDSFEDVQSVEKVLRKLNDLSDDDLECYRYKELRIGEDNATEEYSNDWGWDLGYNFYITVDIKEPDCFYEARKKEN